MFDKLFKRSAVPQQKPVNINVINALELHKDSTYILLADSTALSRSDMEQVMKDIKRSGVRNVVSFMLAGSPDDAIQLVERNKPRAKGKR